MKKTSPKIYSNPGFTLLEMLFAVVIFSFALISIMTIASRGIIATATAKNQLIVEYLGEELLETARNIRDDNYISGRLWNQNLTQCITPAVCDIEYGSPGTPPTLNPCDSDICGTLYEIGGQYLPNASGGNDTTFKRSLSIEPITGITPDSQEYKITATVEWQEKAVPRKTSITTYLSNWQ